MAIKVQNMQWTDMEQMVTRRLRTLKMCKSGHIATDYNKQIDALGPKPAFTDEERKANQAAMSKAIQKALTPTLAECKAMNVNSLVSMLNDRAREVASKKGEHPKLASWNKKVALLKQQKTEREAQLDGDFMDAEDEFKLGLKEITEFPAVYAKLEASVW